MPQRPAAQMPANDGPQIQVLDCFREFIVLRLRLGEDVLQCQVRYRPNRDGSARQLRSIRSS